MSENATPTQRERDLAAQLRGMIDTFRDVCETHIYDGRHPKDCPYCQAIEEAEALMRRR